ncbi:MAG: hypothetical protein JNL11_20090 [Bdellovibrionaceae bacterium]|nr:hypothetical protein [Pseudobdellovibrionaceae bacterium]
MLNCQLRVQAVSGNGAEMSTLPRAGCPYINQLNRGPQNSPENTIVKALLFYRGRSAGAGLGVCS